MAFAHEGSIVKSVVNMREEKHLQSFGVFGRSKANKLIVTICARRSWSVRETFPIIKWKLAV